MNEQQVSDLLKAMAEQTKAMSEQTAAINRMAESTETLAALLYQSLADETAAEMPAQTYLSGKPKG